MKIVVRWRAVFWWLVAAIACNALAVHGQVGWAVSLALAIGGGMGLPITEEERKP